MRNWQDARNARSLLTFWGMWSNNWPMSDEVDAIEAESEEAATAGRGSAVARLVERIQQLIADEGLSFGDSLPTERELAHSFGTSRNTVREALQFLRAYGVIDIRPKAGAVLANRRSDALSTLFTLHNTMSPASFQEVQGFRKIVEIGIGDVIMARIKDEELDRLEQTNRRLLDSRTVRQSAEADYAFHDQLVSLSENGVLVASYRYQKPAMLELMRLGKEARFINEETVRAHQEIIDALRARDRIAYAYLVSRHLEYGMRFVAP